MLRGTTMTDPIRLTQFAKRAGCAAKQPPGYLLSLLGSLPPITDPNVLVGSATADDAAVYKLSDELALVFTTDFFTPIVDRPYDFGAVAAANALSDVYAMGGTPLTALSIVGFPDTLLPPEVLVEILRGAADKAAEAGAAIVGGHTIKSEEPIFGLAVVGKVSPDRVLSNDKAKPGDVLILTKPLGLGIITTAAKNGEDKLGAIGDAIRVMTTLNRVAGEEFAALRRTRVDRRDGLRSARPSAKCRRGQQSGSAHLSRSRARAAGCRRIRAGRHFAGRHACQSQVPRRLGELRRRCDQGRATYLVRRADVGRPVGCRCARSGGGGGCFVASSRRCRRGRDRTNRIS